MGKNIRRIRMKLKNIVLVVENIENSKSFYTELFGLYVVKDFGENVILTEGLVLQEKGLWEEFIEKSVILGGNDAELYFEDNNMDAFLDRLEKSNFDIIYLNKCIERDWGQRLVRIYDPDKHVIEISETEECVARRLLQSGMTVEQVVEKTRMPYTHIEIIAQKDEF
jgi:catechol 2,3-dioxygenase-like lactoylglutathione lyase family enzyme